MYVVLFQQFSELYLAVYMGVLSYVCIANVDSTILRDSHFGGGNGSIFLDNVQCSGSEENLLSCPANPIGVHNCDHKKDAGVRCPETGGKYQVPVIEMLYVAVYMKLGCMNGESYTYLNNSCYYPLLLAFLYPSVASLSSISHSLSSPDIVDCQTFSAADGVTPYPPPASSSE